MKIKELRDKTSVELEKLGRELYGRRLDLQFRAASKQLKNVREFRDLKKTVARTLTLIKEKANK
jgi:ribosomal protein L29